MSDKQDMKALFAEVEDYKSKLIAEQDEALKSQSSDEFKRIVYEAIDDKHMHSEGDHDDEMESQDKDEKMEGMSYDKQFEESLKELEEKLNLHKDVSDDGEEHQAEGQMQHEVDHKESEDDEDVAEMYEGDDMTDNVDQALSDLTEMEDDDMSEIETISEEDSLAKELEDSLNKLKADSAEEGEEGDELSDDDIDEGHSYGEDYEKMKMEADKILEELSENVEDELAKALEREENEKEEMEEGMGMSYTNGKGENKKPESFSTDYPHLVRPEKQKQYEAKIAKLTKIAKTQKAQMESLAKNATKLALFNEGLTGVLHLMLENALTSSEKRNVVEQLMSANPQTIKECKTLIESIKNGINKGKHSPFNASANNGKKKTLKESKAYEDPIFSRMNELCNYKSKK